MLYFGIMNPYQSLFEDTMTGHKCTGSPLSLFQWPYSSILSGLNQDINLGLESQAGESDCF